MAVNSNGKSIDDKDFILDITILMNNDMFINLNFTPFEEHPEFYATYKLLNVKNHNLYSDKCIHSVVDLSKTEMADKKDRAYLLDHWANLFKATTWEEIKMITKNNEYLEEASETLYSMNADETIRAQCRARADYYRLHNTINRKMNELESKVEKLSFENEELASQIEVLKKLLVENDIAYTALED